MLTHARIKTGPYIGLYTQKQDRMFACAHTIQDSMLVCWLGHTHTRPVHTEMQNHMLVSTRTRWDSMLASAHIQDVTFNWLVHTGHDHMWASAHTQAVTIC